MVYNVGSRKTTTADDERRKSFLRRHFLSTRVKMGKHTLLSDSTLSNLTTQNAVCFRGGGPQPTLRGEKSLQEEREKREREREGELKNWTPAIRRRRHATPFPRPRSRVVSRPPTQKSAEPSPTPRRRCCCTENRKRNRGWRAEKRGHLSREAAKKHLLERALT